MRILLATDAASEGIDLQNHCHRLVNYDIPFNPNKLEQRIGRIDRYGQRTPPEIWHFVGTGWSSAVDSYDADLEFLSRVAKKVAQMEEDLGSVNAVLSDAVHAPDARPTIRLRRRERRRVKRQLAARRDPASATRSGGLREQPGRRPCASWASPRLVSSASSTPRSTLPASSRCARTSTRAPRRGPVRRPDADRLVGPGGRRG